MSVTVVYEQYSQRIETGSLRRLRRVDGLRLDGGRQHEHHAAGYGHNPPRTARGKRVCRCDPRWTDRLDWSLGYGGTEPRGDRLHALQSRFADETADGRGHPAAGVGWQAVARRADGSLLERP